jgi:lipopolysaccharide export LptBFGC system permease protein LptF|tara:strand:- start:63 stop:698 length:636 start_codon:yes stop_codon:yes gene_type:complete
MSRRHPKKKSLFQKIIKSKTIHWIDFYGTPILLIIIPLFFVFKSYEISEKELKNIEVTVSEIPEFIKKRKSRNSWASDEQYYINIKTVEYEKNFRIQNTTYNATQTNWVKGIKPNDRITLKVLKTEFKELKEETYWNNYNDIYDLIKDDKSYINLELRSELKSQDMRWLLPISLMGLIMLIFSFIKKPELKIKRVIYIACSILIIILYLYN